jgi:ScaI restriction endonuclease
MSEAISPYQGLPVEAWLDKTKELIQSHPLSSVEIIEIVLKSWNDIFVSTLGSRKHQIG